MGAPLKRLIEQCWDIGGRRGMAKLRARKDGPALAGHGDEAVRNAITRTIITLPEELRRSLTWNQGAEMAQHDRLKIDAGIQVYFCDPQSLWQRSTNETPTVCCGSSRKAQT